MQVSSAKNFWLVSLLWFSITWVIVSPSGEPGLLTQYTESGSHFREGQWPTPYRGHGLPPLAHILVWLFSLSQNDQTEILENIQYIKVIFLFFHTLTGYLIFRFFTRRRMNGDDSLYYTLFYLLNPAVLYNPLIWADTGAVAAFLVSASLYCGFRKRPVWCILLALLAINCDVSTVIFLPLYIAVFRCNYSTLNYKKVNAAVIICLTVQTLLILPFVAGGSGSVTDTLTNDKLSNGAFNFWAILFYDQSFVRPETFKVMGLNANMAGMILFAIFLLWICYLLLNKKFRHHQSNESRLYAFLICAALLPLLFFFFTTGRSAAHPHTAMIFLIVYATVSKRSWPAITGCAAYVLNMESRLRYASFHNYGIAPFDPYFAGSIYVVTIALLFYELFRLQKKVEMNLNPVQHD